MRKVKDYEIGRGIGIPELVEQMEKSGGFTAKKIGTAVKIVKSMIDDGKCKRFLSFPACIVATGTRGVLRDFVKRKWFDVVITTCGTLDHDIARSFGNYYHGSFYMDDEELREMGIHRLGNVLVPEKNYGMLIEKKMRKWLEEISKRKKSLSTYELCWEIGKRLPKSSFLYWCEKRKIPVVIPGITDGAVGYQLWMFSQDHEFSVDIMKDEKLLSDLVWESERTGALIVGGGISKHHTIWWNQFKEGLDYAVYVTTAVEWDGSLSGARPREAVSWKKIKENAKKVVVEMDATVALPLIHSYLLHKVKRR